MASETAKFALELEDGISASSESAEDSLKSLQSQIDKDAKALTEMKKAMRQMQAGGAVDISAFRKLKGEIDSTQDSIGKARASFINLGGDFSKVGKKTSGVKFAPKMDPPKGLNDMISAANTLPMPLSKVSNGIVGVQSKVTGLVGSVGVATAAVLGVVAVLTMLVVALVAVAVATAKATSELLKYAAAQADAMRSERLRLEGLGILHRWMRLTGKDSRQMVDSINAVSSRVPLARSEVAQFGAELHRLGRRGEEAEDAIEAMSIAQAVGGARALALVRMMVRSGVSGASVLRSVQKTYGANAAAQMRSLTMISTKLGESFHALFAGVEIEPLLSGLYRLSQMLSQNTQTGRALKELMEALLEPLIGEIEGAVPALQRFFEELIILALEFAIVLTDIQIAIYRAFGTHIVGQMMQTAGSSKVIRVVFIALGLVVATLTAGVIILGFAVIGLLSPFLLIASAIYLGYQAGLYLVSVIDRLSEAFDPESWAEAGAHMISGIVDGIRSGATRLREAVTGVATDALGVFRGALGIRSPSTVFAQLGLAIPQGVAEGVERGTPEATGAVGNMISTTTNNVASSRGGPSSSVTIGELHIHVGGDGEGSEDTARSVTDAIRDLFETGLAAEPA